MIRSFGNQATEDIYNGSDTKAARKLVPQAIWKVAQRRLSVLDAAHDLRDLRSPGNSLERLDRDPVRKRQWSIRVNDRFRICFYWQEHDATDVEIVDYH